MQTYEESIIAEKVQLDVRRGNMRRFMDTDTFKAFDQERQQEYRMVLDKIDQSAKLLSDRIVNLLMPHKFYGYTVRETEPEDEILACQWTAPGFDPKFWMTTNKRRQNFLVLKESEPIAFFQTETVRVDQVRLHFQASPVASRRNILRGITTLVPLIERALYSRGVRAIFFTSHSPSMVTFMQRLGYETKMEWGFVDGQAMVKRWKESTDERTIPAATPVAR